MEKKEYIKPALIDVVVISDEAIALGCWRAAPSSC